MKLCGGSAFALLTSATALSLALGWRSAEARTLRWLGHATQFQQHIKDGWEAETGHTLEFNGIDANVNPFIDQDLDTDKYYDVFSTSSPFAPWYEKGQLLDLTEIVQDPVFDWQGVTIAGRRNQATYDGKVGAVPIDSDNYLLYYRRDLIAAPPTTWEGLIALGAEWKGRDINGDGLPDFPICLNGDDRFNALLWSILVSLTKYKPGARQGYVWDVADDDSEQMRPLFQSAAWRRAFELAAALWGSTGFPGGRSMLLGTLYGEFAKGRCLTYLSFPSAGTQVVKASGADRPPLWGNLGVTRAPGSAEVLDRETDSMVACDVKLCPSMEAGGINRNTFITGGNSLSIPAHNTENVDLAISFMAYFSRNADVRLASGINPFRHRHFNVSWYLEAETPWNRLDAELYTSAIQQAMESEGSVGVIRVPTTAVIKAAMDTALKKYMRQAGTPFENISAAEADLTLVLRQMEEEVDENTVAAGFTKVAVEQAYRKSLSLPPYAPKDDSVPVLLIVLIALVAVVVLAVVIVVGLRLVGKNATAPKDPTAAMAIVFVGPRNLGVLQGTNPEAATVVLQQFNAAVKAQTKAHKCYTVKRLADTVMIVGKDLTAATKCATAIMRDATASCAGQRHAAGIQVQNGSTTTADLSESATTVSRHSVNSHSRSHSTRASVSLSRFVGHKKSELSFSGGIHYGPCLIHHDEERDVYDYSGANVETTALVADAALPGQLLVSPDVVAAFDDRDAAPPVDLREFRQVTIKGAEKTVYAVAAAGLAKLAKPKTNDSAGLHVENVDSIMAAIEQSNGGVTKKRITVLCVRIAGLKEQSDTSSRDAFSETYVKLSEAIGAVLETYRGYLVALVDGNAIITFNAVHPTPNQVARASSCALTLADELGSEFRVEVRCGLATGYAYVGSQATHQAVVSALYSQASALSMLCGAHKGVRCLATAATCTDVATAIYTMSTDYIVLPQSTAPVAVGALMAFRSPAGAEGAAQDDEWLYELANADKNDPFAETNKAFKSWLGGAEVEQIHAQAAAALPDHTSTPGALFSGAVEFLLQVPTDVSKEAFAEQRSTLMFGKMYTC